MGKPGFSIPLSGANGLEARGQPARCGPDADQRPALPADVRGSRLCRRAAPRPGWRNQVPPCSRYTDSAWWHRM